MPNSVLFITCRNIINSCGELRLIKNRALCLYKEYGVSHDFLVFSHKKPVNREIIDAGGEFLIFRHNLYNPIETRKVFKAFAQEIQKRLKNRQYGAVIISGAPVFLVFDVVKRSNPDVPVFADCHGAYEELLEYKGRSFFYTIARHILYRIAKKNEKRYLPKFDYILAVSNALKEYLTHEYKIESQRIFVVPCSVNRTKIRCDEVQQARMAARKKYSISDDEILFIYSGGTSPWQCIEESVQLFYNLSDQIKKKVKMLVLSGNKAYISKLASNNVIVDSLSSDEVPRILPAGDFAFLIRENYITNQVAYPNKFLEYVTAGLKVISTPYVYDIAAAISRYQLGYILHENEPIVDLVSYVLTNFNYGNDWKSRQSLLDDVCFENRLSFWRDLFNAK